MFMSMWKQGALILMFITAVPALPTRPILKRHDLEPSVHHGSGMDMNEALRELELDVHSLERTLANERYDYFYPSTHGHKTVPSASSRATVVHSTINTLERVTGRPKKAGDRPPTLGEIGRQNAFRMTKAEVTALLQEVLEEHPGHIDAYKIPANPECVISDDVEGCSVALKTVVKMDQAAVTEFATRIIGAYRHFKKMKDYIETGRIWGAFVQVMEGVLQAGISIGLAALLVPPAINVDFLETGSASDFIEGLSTAFDDARVGKKAIQEVAEAGVKSNLVLGSLSESDPGKMTVDKKQLFLPDGAEKTADPADDEEGNEFNAQFNQVYNQHASSYAGKFYDYTTGVAKSAAKGLVAGYPSNGLAHEKAAYVFTKAADIGSIVAKVSIPGLGGIWKAVKGLGSIAEAAYYRGDKLNDPGKRRKAEAIISVLEVVFMIDEEVNAYELYGTRAPWPSGKLSDVVSTNKKGFVGWFFRAKNTRTMHEVVAKYRSRSKAIKDTAHAWVHKIDEKSKKKVNLAVFKNVLPMSWEAFISRHRYIKEGVCNHREGGCTTADDDEVEEDDEGDDALQFERVDKDKDGKMSEEELLKTFVGTETFEITTVNTNTGVSATKTVKVNVMSEDEALLQKAYCDAMGNRDNEIDKTEYNRCFLAVNKGKGNVVT